MDIQNSRLGSTEQSMLIDLQSYGKTMRDLGYQMVKTILRPGTDGPEIIPDKFNVDVSDGFSTHPCEHTFFECKGVHDVA